MQIRPHKALFPLLRCLADGRFHSGETLARQLGLSRASVFNALAEAEAMGLSIHAVRGRGYRLAEPVEWLDAATLNAHLADVAPHYTIRVGDAVESTNTVLMQEALGSAPNGTVLCAEYQSAGRGRRGRQWHSALGGSLTFSVLWRFETGLQSLAGLSLAVGLAIARAVNQHSAHTARLKWPNDVLVDFRKLAGILVEVQGDLHGAAFAIVGVGINVRLAAGQRDRVDQAVVDLAEMGVGVGRNQLLADCLRELHAVIEVFRNQGFAALRPLWLALDAYHGRAVALALPNASSVRGKACGVDGTGALLLGDELGNVVPYSGGELSLRLEGRR